MNKHHAPENGQFVQKPNNGPIIALKWIVYITLVMVIAGSITYLWQTSQREPLEYQAPKSASKVDLSIPNTREKIEARLASLKVEILATMRAGETSNKTIEAGQLFYTNDPKRSDRPKCAVIGGKRDLNCDSWGAYQFKIPTVQLYYQKLYNQNISQVDAMLVALDIIKAEALAYDIVIKEKGGIKSNWENTYYANEDFFETAITQVRTLESVL